MRKHGDNLVEHFQIGTVKRFRQPAEKCDLRRVQRTTVQVNPVRYSHATVTALDCFNRIGTSQNDKVPVNGPPADVKLMCQIASSLIPPEAKYLQNLLAAFPRVHVHSRKILSSKIEIIVLVPSAGSAPRRPNGQQPYADFQRP